MKFKIICIGKLKEKYLIDAARDYALKISRHAPLEIIELPEGASSNDILESEAKHIEALIPKGDFVVCAAVEGKKLSPNALSCLLKKKSAGGVTFIIGGPIGLSERIKNKAGLLLSFSDLTFTHRLARLILLDSLLSMLETALIKT